MLLEELCEEVHDWNRSYDFNKWWNEKAKSNDPRLKRLLSQWYLHDDRDTRLAGWTDALKAAALWYMRRNGQEFANFIMKLAGKKLIKTPGSQKPPEKEKTKEQPFDWSSIFGNLGDEEEPWDDEDLSLDDDDMDDILAVKYETVYRANVPGYGIFSLAKNVSSPELMWIFSGNTEDTFKIGKLDRHKEIRDRKQIRIVLKSNVDGKPHMYNYAENLGAKKFLLWCVSKGKIPGLKMKGSKIVRAA